MRPMQATPGDAQPTARQDEAISVQLSAQGIIRWVRIIVLFYLIGIFVALWQSDEFRLEALNATIKLLQNVARIFGSWALSVEQSYNDHVESLH